MTFASDVSRITKEMERDAVELSEAVFISLFKSVIESTPVDTGRLRGNWQTTQDSPASGDVSRIQKREFGTASREVVATVKGLGTFYLTNNLPYAHKAEFGGWGTGPGATIKTTRDGFSVQAPHGMVRKNAKRVKRILRKESRGFN